MDMQGQRVLHVTQAQAWDALNDPEILKSCIPGCDKFELTEANVYNVGVAIKIGPVSAKFSGKVTLSDIQAPNSYAIAFEGQGGVAGFGKGGAHVQLATEGQHTRLSYQVKASVGGKLAQIGSRLVDAAAKKISEDFFKAFNEKVASLHPAAQTSSEVTDAHAPTQADHDDHHPEPVADDPDKPQVSTATLRWLAAGALVVLIAILATSF
jgi:carbon monoxide dehydrogenase subunit G